MLLLLQTFLLFSSFLGTRLEFGMGAASRVASG
jgi:hypothetical protein